MSEGESVFFKITDKEFAEERLRESRKHYRDYGRLPDKGQFPYVEYDGKSHELVFRPSVFIPEGVDSNKITVF